MSNIIVWEQAIVEAEQAFVEIAKGDGNIVAWKREAAFAMQAMQGPNGEYLRKSTPESIRNAVVNVAAVGLTLSPALKLAYLVPRKLKDGGPVMCCLDVSYVGMCHLAVESGAVLAVMAESVRERDGFEYVNGFTHPKHTFNPFASQEDRGDIIGVYCVARLKSGVDQVETLSMQEINKIRASSKAQNGPWATWFEEMAKKSVIKRAAKLWPRSDRLARAIETINEHEGDERIVQVNSGDASEAAVDAAKEAVEAVLEQRTKILALVDATESREALNALWRSGGKQLTETKDIEGANLFRAAVKARAEKLAA